MIRKAIPIIASLLVFSHSAYADVSLTIKGLDGALEDNVNAYLSSIPEDDYSTSLRFQARLDQSITEAMNDSEEYFEVDRLGQVVQENPSLTAQQLIQSIYD